MAKTSAYIPMLTNQLNHFYPMVTEVFLKPKPHDVRLRHGLKRANGGSQGQKDSKNPVENGDNDDFPLAPRILTLYSFRSALTGGEQRRTWMDKLLLSISDAANVLSIGRSKMYQLIAQGKVVTVTIGRRRLVQCESVRALALDEAA